MSWLGIDIGTSAVKAVIIDDQGTPMATASAPLSLAHPKPLWSEQDPQDWWNAACQAVRALDPDMRKTVQGVGLSGQMHGAVLLDEGHRVLRPAILWNDNRAHAQCEELDPLARKYAGNLALPGFTAPKLLWLRDHEPEIFAKIHKIVLPKDYIRLRLSGTLATEMSDASGTLWLDIGKRKWSPELIDACGLNVDMMPHLFEGTSVTGELTRDAAMKLGLPVVSVAGGGGDQAAGAVGVGAVNDGDAFISLGTSGVIFAVTDTFSPNPASVVHAFCHAVPDRWHVMSVMLATGESIDWICKATAFKSVGEAVEAGLRSYAPNTCPFFLPYLSGGRTPHNNPKATGTFAGLTGEHSRETLVAAVLEGVAFSLRDGLDALALPHGPLMVVGGGTRSEGWMQLLANVLQRTLHISDGADVGPAMGAARLAACAVQDFSSVQSFNKPSLRATFYPRHNLDERLVAFRSLYPAVNSADIPFPKELSA